MGSSIRSKKCKLQISIASEIFPQGFMNMNIEDGTKLGDHPAVIKAFAMLADKMGEDKIVQADGPII